MNYMGMMYKEGLGCVQDYEKAIEWFIKAGDGGYGNAWYNLGLMYKFGVGVEMDYEKSYAYFLKCAEAGLSGGMYGVGYLMYRGHGTPQNYEGAVEWLQKGADIGNPSCMYMLAVCIRNGYGIKKDIKQAKYWLGKSDSLGYKFANDELYASEAENENVNANFGLINEESSDSLKSFKKIGKNKHKIKINGKWNGTKITYDYSGKHILKAENFSLIMHKKGAYVYGDWHEGDSLKMAIEGTIADNALYFTKGNYSRQTRYKRRRNWNMKQGYFEAKIVNGKEVLAGNLEEFSPDLLEPGRPIYVQLEKEHEKKVEELSQDSLVADTTQEEQPDLKIAQVTGETDPFLEAAVESIFNEKPQMKVYPNPFSDLFSIEYTLSKPGKVNIYLYDMHGRLVMQFVNSTKAVGTYHHQQDAQNLANGTYLVNMTVNGIRIAKNQLIIKIN
jgi:hypothetical protein